MPHAAFSTRRSDRGGSGLLVLLPAVEVHVTGIPELISHGSPVLRILVAFCRQMLDGLRRSHVSGRRTGLLDDAAQLVRVLQHRARTEVIVVERLSCLISLEQRLLQALDEALLLDVGLAVMNEDAGFHIAVRVDVAVVLAAGDTAVYHLTIVLEINGEDRKAGLIAADFADSVIHIFALLRIQKQGSGGLVSDRHVVEVPGEVHTLVDQHLQELIACDGLVVDRGVADRGSDRQMMLAQDIHGMHDLVEAAIAAAAVVCLGKALDGDGGNQVADPEHILSELIVDQRAVGENHKIGSVVLLAELEDICLAGGRLAAGHDPCVNAELLALRDDGIELLIGQALGMAVLCSPASGAVHVAGGGGIDQDNPRNGDTVLL